jgi:sensor histidine kinase YesM
MNKVTAITFVWTGLAIVIFAVFRWLFGIAMPGAALAFSIGITVILMGGILSGWYASRARFNPHDLPGNLVFTTLGGTIAVAFFAFALLVNLMMGETEFLEFSMAIFCLFVMSASAGALVSLVRLRIKNKLQVAKTASEHSKSELQLLQSQLSPHFLFNTLNNVYGLSISDHTKVPSLLLKLSDLLRYSIYETKELFVPVQNELQYLKNYIEFEKMRLGDRLQLTSNMDSTPVQDFKIAPMILIVFVENAFKHSRNTPEDKIYIEINFNYDSAAIFFSVKNSYLPAQQTTTQNRQSGFGLENVKKRLALLYEAAHDLKIEPSGSTFRIDLRLSIVK